MGGGNDCVLVSCMIIKAIGRWGGEAEGVM